MAIKVLNPESRGLMENTVFRGQTVFSNGIQNTPRPNAFGAVYVFNDDILYPKSFLGMHPHSNVEIVTIMVSGTESHKDTIGIHENYTTGDVQLISSGKGVHHEGGNVSETEDARHLQIWIAPSEQNLEPTVQLRKAQTSKSGLTLVVSPDGAEESLKINQHVWMFEGQFNDIQNVSYQIQELGNGVMIYLISGELSVNGITVSEGATAFVTDANDIELISNNPKTTFVLIETVM